MAHPVVIRVKKLATMGQIAGSAGHTWRERPTPNADPTRTHLNRDLRPVTGSVALREAVQARLDLATEKLPANPVRCIEYLITANKDAFRERGGTLDHERYLADALAWIEGRHGAANVVAVNIQLDEQAPHLVAYVVPLVEVEAKTRKRSVIVGTNPDGTKRRETRTEQQDAAVRLSAAHYLDGRAKLSQLQTDFAEEVGKAHGLVRGVRGSKAKHTTVKQFYAGIERAERPQPKIPAAALKQRELVPGEWLKKPVVETLEQVAERLTEAMHKEYAPTLAAAGGAAIERKQRKQAMATAQAKATELEAARPILDATAGLPAADLAKLVEQARGMQRAAQVAAEAARRAGAIVELAKRTGSAVGRWATWAMAAITKAGGDHTRVTWVDVDGAWAKAAMQGKDGHPLTMTTAMTTVLDHSPMGAGMPASERAKVLDRARRHDHQAGPEPEPEGPSLGR